MHGLRLIENSPGRPPESLAFSQDGLRLAWGTSPLEDRPGQVVVQRVAAGPATPQPITLTSPGFRPGALAFDRLGGLLVGEAIANSRVTEHAYLRLAADGSAREPCRASPPGVGREEWAQRRGVVSIVELADGRVVTGGPDDSLAVWTGGCSAQWPRGSSCCRSESAVLVAGAPEPGEFLTLGETRWIDEEHGGTPLGLRRWRGPPWSVAPAQGFAALSDVDGGSGAGSGATPGGLLAIATDGSCIAEAQEGTLRVTDPSGKPPRRIQTRLTGHPEHLAVAPRCAAVALVVADGLWLCDEGDCSPF